MVQFIDVTAAVFQSPTGVAAFRRNPDKAHGGRWEFPGGKMEPGETAEEGMRRELHEELSLHVTTIIPLRPVVHHYPGRENPIRLFPFLIQIEQRSFFSTDHSEIRWVTREEAVQLDWLEADIPVLEQAFNEKSI